MGDENIKTHTLLLTMISLISCRINLLGKSNRILEIKHIKKNTYRKERKLLLGFLESSKKTEEIFKLEKQIEEMDEEIEQNKRDSEELNELKEKVVSLNDRITKVHNNVVSKIDYAKSRLLSMGYGN